MALRAPPHFPGPCKRYWYGVQGPKKTSMASFGSERNRNRRLGFTPTRVAISSMYSMWSTWMVCRAVFTYLKHRGSVREAQSPAPGRSSNYFYPRGEETEKHNTTMLLNGTEDTESSMCLHCFVFVCLSCFLFFTTLLNCSLCSQ